MKVRLEWACKVLAMASVLAWASSALAADVSGTFLLTADIHFDPFDPPKLAESLADEPAEKWPEVFAAIGPQAAAKWGSDTNYALFSDSLSAIAETARDADFALVVGDLLAHTFEEKAAKALGVSPTDAKVRELAVNTTIFVGDRLAGALPDRPIIVALGNNDSDCGDYEITPGGKYLAETAEMIRRLVGDELLGADFDQTYAAGGYYTVRHPARPEVHILVVNDILWSAKYRDSCGSGGDAAADAMLAWLRSNLASQKAAGGSVWLVHHIPWGIDPFSTAHSKATSCDAKAVPFLTESYAKQFVDRLNEYADVIQASFAAHIHTDDFRLLVDEQSRALAAAKITSAISPIYGQNPGYEIFTYDPRTGAPTDYSSYYLANLGSASLAVTGEWRLEYTFSHAYDVPQYSTENVAKAVTAIEAGGASAETYRRFYNAGHGELPEDHLPAYLCAMTELEESDFTKCYCGG